MSNFNFPYSEAPLKTVQEIQFGLFSPEETKNMSVCHIEYPETVSYTHLTLPTKRIV